MLKSTLAYAVLGFGVLCSLNGCKSSQTQQIAQSPSISGVVVDPRGEAVSGAQVTTDPPTDLVKTRAAGKFRLRQMEDGANIPSGTYKLMIAADNYRLATEVKFSYQLGDSVDLGSIQLQLEKGIEWRKVTSEDGTVKFVPVGGDEPKQGL